MPRKLSYMMSEEEHLVIKRWHHFRVEETLRNVDCLDWLIAECKKTDFNWSKFSDDIYIEDTKIALECKLRFG